MAPSLFVGIDAGGTKSAARARLADAADGSLRDDVPGDAARTFAGPGAQATRDGTVAAAETLVALVAEAQAAFRGVPLGGVAVGLAGAGQAETQAAIADALRVHFGAVPLAVTHDAEVALQAAWGDGSGAVLIVGTGSVVHARTADGRALRAGGWGPALGDDGSGTALGRAALRAVLAAWDGGPPTSLVETADETHGLADAAAVVAAAHAPGLSLARFAPLLLAAAGADDWVATSLLARETNALAQQAGWLATVAGETVTPRLALAGGLAGEAVYTAALGAALDRHLPGWTVGRTPVDPTEGALALALRAAAPVAA